TRYGFAEESYFTFSFSPLRDDGERITGVLQIVTEVTAAVLAERRASLLHAPSNQTALARTLPRDRVAGASAGPTASPSTAPRSEARILVADDNPDTREYLVRLLSQRWQVDAVADGQAALDAAIAAPPDVVLSDVMMPNLDGIGLIKALRAHPSTSTVPVILLSARAGE